ncbi:Sialoadhesin Sialic acid-binding Ig-like lectin 1 [Channa argus]|uniref:Sialoadhesin Sialic acid-binding Ig-like lectin 1 n=1 Tax=Channa argus TaxID=215402 RepID=A0A6G1QMG2_CHAAH|nr:Sialoadhesin Sialic acid-binding Ig-like lectin 1 [Channa argus]
MDLLGMLLSVLFVSGASADCSKPADLFITAPQKMEALSGSCLMIPCNFRPKLEQEFSSTRETFGIWIKNNFIFSQYPNNVILNSSGTVTIYPMKITGNLREKNCTTVFSNLTTTHTDTYYFRIENEPFMATASCDPLQITVKDSAPSPIIKIPGDVKEKESVTITCSALTPCPHSPPKLTWTLQQDPHTNIEENTDGTFTTKIQETITLSDRHDGLNISCSATYTVNRGRDVRTAETQETLRVSYAPKDTSASISPSGSVSTGTWVNLSCSSRARPPVSSFTWFKSSKDGARTVSEGAFYSFNATQGGVYYCVAANDLGNQTSALIHLIIEGNKLFLTWAAVIGGIIGVVVVTYVAITMWWLKSKHPSSHQTQSLTNADPVYQEPTTTIEEENVLYDNLNFSSLRTEVSYDSMQDSGQQQDIVCAQVKVSKTSNRLTADGPEVLYGQVKKK